MEYILIADDNKDITDILEKYVKKEGYGALIATDGIQTEELFHTYHPAAILLDVMMPGMDGFQTCDAIRKDSNVPVLFLTAKSAENDRVSAYSSGGDDFLSKPFSSVELLAKVSSLLRRYKEYRGKPEAALAAALRSLRRRA